MNAAPSPSVISIDVRVEGGRVGETSVRSGGRSPAETLFRHRDCVSVPKLAESVFALCPMAQSAAADHVIAAATGSTIARTPGRTVRLIAERISESLRSIVLGWPGDTPDADTLAWLRGALAVLRAIAGAPHDEASRHVELLRAHAHALGLPQAPDEAIGAGWLGRIWRDVADDELLVALRAPQPLASAADDEAMFDALDAMAQTLPAQPAPDIDFPTHLRARLDGIARSIADLDLLVRGEAQASYARTRRTVPGVAVVAIDCPRGRLYHRVVLDDHGHVLNYRIVSPTDRNFAVGGPFARALAGARIGESTRAEQRVARLAALFDPCVALEIRVAERVDA